MMNSLDKWIKANFLLIKEEIVTYLVFSVVTGFFIVIPTMFGLFAPLIYMIVLLIIQYRIYKKLFYTSVYGDGAVLYNSFPVSVEEMVQGKVIVIGIVQLIEITVTALIIIISGFIGLFHGLSCAVLDALEVGIGITGKSFFILCYLSINIAGIGQALMIFYMIIYHNSQKDSERNKAFLRLILVMLAMVINTMLFSMTSFFIDVLEMEPAIWMPILNLFVNIILLVLFYKLSVNRFKLKYELK